MTKKDFQLIARTLKDLRDMDLTAWQTEALIAQFSDALAHNHPRL
jgi:hypothetical protein